MIDIKILQNKINDCFLNNSFSIIPLRSFVFEFYEAENNQTYSEQLELFFSILSPYLEYEEAYGDSEAENKIIRLKKISNKNKLNNSSIVFALNFETIQELYKKNKNSIINDKVFNEQIKKLSPGNFEPKKIIEWIKKNNVTFDDNIL